MKGGSHKAVVKWEYGPATLPPTFMRLWGDWVDPSFTPRLSFLPAAALEVCRRYLGTW